MGFRGAAMPDWVVHVVALIAFGFGVIVFLFS